MNEELTERGRRILEAIVEDFIESGEPVGSRSITRRHKLNLSPATVRNVMADLEEAGFIYSPHTSAGRIPTEKGYRLYVNTLARFQEPGVELERGFERLEGAGLEERLQGVGRILSGVSSYAGIVSAPSFDATVFSSIRFVRISERKVLAVLVSSSGMVQNRIICTDEDIPADNGICQFGTDEAQVPRLRTEEPACAPAGAVPQRRGDAGLHWPRGGIAGAGGLQSGDHRLHQRRRTDGRAGRAGTQPDALFGGYPAGCACGRADGAFSGGGIGTGFRRV